MDPNLTPQTLQSEISSPVTVPPSASGPKYPILLIIFLLILILGLVSYISYQKLVSSNTKPSPTILTNPTTPPTPPSTPDQQPIEKSDAETESVKKAACDTVTGSKCVATVDKREGDFATGSLQIKVDETGGPGSMWLVKKINGVWTKIWGGQEPPSCAVLKPYGVPSSIIECQ